MKAVNKTIIAGNKTTADWKAVSPSLVGNRDPKLWKQVFKNFLSARLDSRYLAPIRLLQQQSNYSGEGFTITAIQCTLIEFLAATVKGESYRFLRAGEKRGAFEYTSSSGLFISFLSSQEPFRQQFTRDDAEEFYKSIRCGLLHEAATKNGWRIRARSKNGKALDSVERIVYRDGLQRLLTEFIQIYGKRLIIEVPLQEAFIRKFNKLAE